MLARREDQIPFSFQRSLRGLFFGSPIYQMTLANDAPGKLQIPPQDMWPADGENGIALQNGIFSLAGQTLTCPEPNFMPRESTPGWRAALHRFAWLRDLRAAGGDQSRRTARRWVAAWLAAYHEWEEEAWDPLTTALRLRHWLQNHDFFCASADDEFRYAVYDSIARQASHLSRVVPGMLDGAELLAALEGLILCGLSIPGRTDYFNVALRHYCRELENQILPDGGHTSRSPGTLFNILMGMMMVRSALTHARQEIPFEISTAIERAALMIKLFRHGDGGLALFHHTTEQMPVLLDAVLNQADVRRTLKSANVSGYERAVQGRSLLILDAGQPAEAPTSHAGTLAFEFSSGKDRLITNCGCYRGTGPWRAVLASTAAHSVLGINDTNSTEFIASQTAARRIKRRPEYVTVTRSEGSGLTRLDARHDGYRELCGAVHTRSLTLEDAGETLAGEDKLTGMKTRISFTLRFHLHPNVQASMTQDGQAVLLRLPAGTGWRFRYEGPVALALEASVYSGDGATQRRSQQIVLTGQADSSVQVSWRLARERKA
jgi:uncharacterized heparinase superfamily protein